MGLVHTAWIDIHIALTHSYLGVSKYIRREFPLDGEFEPDLRTEHIGKIHPIEYIMHLSVYIPMS